MGETRQLAEFAIKFRLDECPLPVIAQAKRCIIETLGCALAGAKTSLAQAAVRSVKRQGEGGCATVIGLGFRAAPDRAAFINGISANALDYDGGIMRQGHYGPTAVPSALAAGELVGASGRQLLEAVIVAYEVVSRIGRAIRASEPQSRLVSGYGPHQGFASVAAVGRLLGLTVDQMAIIVASLAWLNPTRTIRAQVLSLRERGYVEVARLSGLSGPEIIFREMMPNLLPYLAATLVNAVSNAILASIGLEVLGLGPIESPTLGMTLYWVNYNAALINGWWWWWTAPIVIILAVFLGLFFLTVGLDEIANPRLRRAA